MRRLSFYVRAVLLHWAVLLLPGDTAAVPSAPNGPASTGRSHLSIRLDTRHDCLSEQVTETLVVVGHEHDDGTQQVEHR